MIWQLYPRGKSFQYPLVRSLSGPQSWCGRGDEEKNNCKMVNQSIAMPVYVLRVSMRCIIMYIVLSSFY